MYQNIFYNRRENEIFLWDDQHGMISFKYPRHAYQRAENGEYTSIYGDKLEKISAFNDEHDPNLFESDLQPELRVLTDAYLESDEPSEGHKIVVIDIEVDSSGGFPDIMTGDKTITAIALYDFVSNQYIVYVLDPESKVNKMTHDNVVILGFKNEEDLLHSFLNKWNEISPTIVTGWNTNGFDLPYLYNRIKAVLGKYDAYRLSPIKTAYQNTYTEKMVIAGISCLDYMELYKKFSGVMRPSYALGAIAKDEELQNQKLTYRGSLVDLYQSDLNRFVEYNLTDVKIVVELDHKYDFIFLARSVCHKGHIPYEWFQMSSRFIDGAILVYLHRNNLIAPNKPMGGREEYAEMVKEGEDKFTGAYVKEPIPGIYDWIYSADITSLYPSTIMTLNISPETKIAKIEAWDYKDFLHDRIPEVKLGETTYSIEEFKKLIANNAYSVSSNGVVYRQDFMGVVPTILDLWFKERIEYRELAKKYKKEGNNEKASFYNRRQLRQKIFLNSVYGSLGLPVFRFYDRDNAEATTLSGQTIIKSAEFLVNKIYNERLLNCKKITEEQDFVKYIDTDSVYISSQPLASCEEIYPEDMKQYTIKTATEIAEKINEFYKFFVPKIFNIHPDKNRIKITEDVIAAKALWTAKKRYAMLKVYDMENKMDVSDKNGNPGKLETKGIDIVRSSFPLEFKKIAAEILEMILRDYPKTEINEKILIFEESLDEVPILNLGKTTSVKFISQKGDNNYNPSSRKRFQFLLKTPIGVKSALAYNDLIYTWKLTKQVELIKHGQKIKWVYLFPNEYGIESLALKGDDTDPDKMLEFVESYIDRRKMYNSELKSKMSEFYHVLGWDYPNRGSQLAHEFFGGESGDDW